MAPDSRRGKPRENAFPFELGFRGRKTGITVPDSGIRDADGFEPTDHYFSSPDKGDRSRSARKLNGHATLSSGDMDEGESTIPEPIAVLASRKSGSIILPPPKAKSPIKTNLRSPARRNPSLGPVSSPVRGTIIEPRAASVSTSVRRKLDFSIGGYHESPTMSPQKKRGGSTNPSGVATRLGNNAHIPSLKRPFDSVGDEEDEDDDLPDQIQSEDAVALEAAEESYEVVNGIDDEEIIPEVDEENEVQEPKAVSARKRKGMRKSSSAAMIVEDGRATPEESPVPEIMKKAKGGRPKKAEAAIDRQDSVERPRKRARRSDGSEAPEPAKTKSKKPALTSGNSKRSNKTSKLAEIAETDSPQIQRGPPMPRRAGLLVVRRETPIEGTAFKQTRSGRTSIKPVAYWKNEKAEYSDDEVEDRNGKFLVPRIKGVVRVDEVFDTKKKPRRAKATKAMKRIVESDDESAAEPWETQPGRVYGDVVFWDPQESDGEQVEERREEIALSSAAIITREIADSSFKFAKTLTLPFFGSGVVDLPPGSVKRTKNSRKMQMVFFVFTGRVKAIVNGNEFRIGKGGMFQVPRGNTYSIVNDYDMEARIFFSQGCEIVIENVGESQTPIE